MDLWSLLSIVAPGLHPRPALFKELWAKPIENGGDAERLAALRRRIRPLMLRRTKEAVATELPPKMEQVLSVDLHPRHRAVYDRHLQRERQRLLGLIDDVNGNRIAILRALTVLRQMSLDPSLVDDGVRRAGVVGQGRRAGRAARRAGRGGPPGPGVLAVHRVPARSCGPGSRPRASPTSTSTGRPATAPSGSRRSARATAPVFLISLKAGGFGLTLTEADYVFVLDPWWNPAAEAQAIDRTHRIGQTRPVNVYRMVSRDTIEEKVVALQERKRDLFARVVDEGAALSAALTADDLRELLDA